jgi:hypothetical protein
MKRLEDIILKTIAHGIAGAVLGCTFGFALKYFDVILTITTK